MDATWLGLGLGLGLDLFLGLGLRLGLGLGRGLGLGVGVGLGLGLGALDVRHLLPLGGGLAAALLAHVARAGARAADGGHVVGRVVAPVAVRADVVGAVVPRPRVAAEPVAVDEVPRVVARGLRAVGEG